MTDKLFNYKKAEKLVHPDRQKWLPVDHVLELLQLNPENTVADLGCGNGYLTLPIANQVHTDVHAVDVQQPMLDLLKARAAEQGVSNINYILSTIEELPLDKQSIDVAIASLVLHEVPHLEKMMQELKGYLRSDGKWLILDWEAVESEAGPPIDHRISSQEMKAMLEKAGYRTEVGHVSDAVYYMMAKLK
ncbi:ubiquinone/menaquinone biosynthesis C-methylase UbiE [Bacillus ectoiniformans]|uniref:class I SAM-dependent methyltransferase n=1 Tax=Bacillus ectoiniformans TaxID=1494429 RepID=UPI00195DD7C1|nr:class I SAM-dependent methyltransferase [Bacillus ectoiniformans]MBM7648783.1 ubiquinone/menaquinone biosynthesis C-methylase UbiE [Bacillus ectoiniformans]